MHRFRADDVIRFFDKLRAPDMPGYSSVPGGKATLYGTAYALLARHYLGIAQEVDREIGELVASCQRESGEFVGPELSEYRPTKGALHDWDHLVSHSTCAVLPVCVQFQIPIRYPLFFAHKYCDPHYLQHWLDARDFRHAWFEGNNLLFVGQLLVHLRDFDRFPGADAALQQWFDWLDAQIDPATSLWGTDGDCDEAQAVYGGYHQLLIYTYEGHRLPSPEGLVDTVLALQHCDGGFAPGGNGGACEDVDCVDILVNLYKQMNYRRMEIRIALRRCLGHILATQNPDGGFPYNRNQPQSHMSIPDTVAAANVSTAFATWFRVHTLALIAEVLPDEPALCGVRFGFSKPISMGWHRQWDRGDAQVIGSGLSRLSEAHAVALHRVGCFFDFAGATLGALYRHSRRFAGRVVRAGLVGPR